MIWDFDHKSCLSEMPSEGRTFQGKPDKSLKMLLEEKSFLTVSRLSASFWLTFWVTKFGNAGWNMRAPVKLFNVGSVVPPWVSRYETNAHQMKVSFDIFDIRSEYSGATIWWFPVDRGEVVFRSQRDCWQSLPWCRYLPLTIIAKCSIWESEIKWKLFEIEIHRRQFKKVPKFECTVSSIPE